MGNRRERYSHVEILCRLTGARAALVVNNNAGAVLLALHPGQGKRIASRGELVEIGDPFGSRKYGQAGDTQGGGDHQPHPSP